MMNEKAIVDIYYTYGKGDGDELGERFVINNTPEEREEIFEDLNYDYVHDSKESFIGGKIDVFTFDRYGGDWDEPTGGYVTVNTKDELINEVEKKAQDEVARIEKLFERE